MKNEIKVIIKKPIDPVGTTESIRNDLETLQRIVGGCIETIYIDVDGETAVMICNETGKLSRLKPNIWVGNDIICGTLIFCGVDGEEFDDTPIQLNEWVKLMEEWGNQ